MSFSFKPDVASNQTKLQQLIHAINEAISNGVLKEGEFLPSVNQLSRKSGLSRDTIFKAYSLLKQRSIISSTPTKGYFISSLSFKVMVLLDDFSAFKEQLYNSFRSNLPDNYTVDLLFHHYNPDIFDQLILNSLGRYSMYIVMNFRNQGMEDVLKKIDPNKLLILDMGSPDTPDVSYLTQDFTFGVLDCLREGLHLIKKYREFNLIFPETLYHPKEFVNSYTYFCNSNNLKSSVIRSIKDHPVEAGQAFLVIREDDLVYIIKQCRLKGLKPGEDVGLISYNDTPMKEIVGSGITTISVNFAEMGEKAARFVESKEKIFEILPPRLIIRGSL
ncbi:MAG: substrate-binding domain-containing protein [Prolixibacteraceae bacterium]